MSHEPPKILRSILSRFCKRSLWESIEGDLHELYLMDLNKYGKRKAARNYLINALAFLRYQRLRKTQNSNSTMGLMKNYVKVSYRDLIRHKLFTTINLVGLVAGMAASIFILQYVLFHTGFDTFHKDSDRIYRVINDRFQQGELLQHGAITYPTIGPTMKQDFPEVESFTRMMPNGRNYIEFRERLFSSNEVFVVDEHFLSFFSFNLIEGQKETSLDEPYEVVLTKSIAESMLGDEQALTDLIGESLKLDFGDTPLKITAVVEDPPGDSHVQFNMLISYKTFIALAGEGANNSWQWSDFYHYIKLKEGVDSQTLNGKLADFGPRYFKQGEVSGAEEVFYLQALSDLHLDDSMAYEFAIVTNGNVIWLMLAVAIFIIVIAWINYINLSTSRAIQRAKEVGVRKSLGAHKWQIIKQFIIETFIINTIAFSLSLLFVFLLQPFFNELIGGDLSLSILFASKVYGIPFPFILGAFFMLSSMVIGVYPAFLVTKFTTQDIIKGSFQLKGEIVWLRRGLVVFQFCTAIVLITASLTISKQIDFMTNKDLGLEIDNTMVIRGPGFADWDSTFIKKVDLFKSQLNGLSGVEMVTASNRVPGDRTGRTFDIKSSADPENKRLAAGTLLTDHDFIKLYGIELLAGRTFSLSDHNIDGDLVKNILINKNAVKRFKFDDEEAAIGRTINFWNKDWTILGVIDDFHQRSLHTQIEPMVFIPYYNTDQYYSLKLSASPSEAMVERIQDVFDKAFPGNYFDYFYLEDQYLSQYEADVRLGHVSRVFTFLSILIASLGLYGLILANVVRRTKEIGVRKVLGASMNQILLILSKEFLILIGLALFIGVPVSYYLLEKWQESFAYALETGFGTILIGIFSILAIYVVVVLIQARKVSKNNPVESLRYE